MVCSLNMQSGVFASAVVLAPTPETCSQHKVQPYCCLVSTAKMLREAHMRDGGREGTGSKPCTSLREVPTRALKALPNTLLATRGDPNVMHRMSASGYSNAAHAAPVAWQSFS